MSVTREVRRASRLFAPDRPIDDETRGPGSNQWGTSDDRDGAADRRLTKRDSLASCHSRRPRSSLGKAQVEHPPIVLARDANDVPVGTASTRLEHVRARGQHHAWERHGAVERQPIHALYRAATSPQRHEVASAVATSACSTSSGRQRPGQHRRSGRTAHGLSPPGAGSPPTQGVASARPRRPHLDAVPGAVGPAKGRDRDRRTTRYPVVGDRNRQRRRRRLKPSRSRLTHSWRSLSPEEFDRLVARAAAERGTKQ